jgi:hypothetical protein
MLLLCRNFGWLLEALSRSSFVLATVGEIFWCTQLSVELLKCTDSIAFFLVKRDAICVPCLQLLVLLIHSTESYSCHCLAEHILYQAACVQILQVHSISSLCQYIAAMKLRRCKFQ